METAGNGVPALPGRTDWMGFGFGEGAEPGTRRRVRSPDNRAAQQHRPTPEDSTLSGLEMFWAELPRVAAPRQPWADRSNPSVIGELAVPPEA